MSTHNEEKNTEHTLTRVQLAEYLLLRCLASGIKNELLAEDVRLFIESKSESETITRKQCIDQQ